MKSSPKVNVIPLYKDAFTFIKSKLFPTEVVVKDKVTYDSWKSLLHSKNIMKIMANLQLACELHPGREFIFYKTIVVSYLSELLLLLFN